MQIVVQRILCKFYINSVFDEQRYTRYGREIPLYEPFFNFLPPSIYVDGEIWFVILN